MSRSRILSWGWATAALVSITACIQQDGELECGEGTVVRDGLCVALDTDTDTPGESESETEAGSGDETSTTASDGPSTDSGPPNTGDTTGPPPGDCVGRADSCNGFVDQRSCLQQTGCFPNAGCVGVAIECFEFGFGSRQCDAAPHCYSDIMRVGGTTLPGCWQYDTGCTDGTPGIDDCEAYGGTCQEVLVCDGRPEPCEVAFDQVDCEEQSGCFWQT